MHIPGFEILLFMGAQWAQEQEALILRTGVALAERELALARGVGVAEPGKVRLLKVEQVPLPTNPLLVEACRQSGMLGPNTTGLTLRYGIFVRADHWGNEALIAHELVHTAQYERLGGFKPFLRAYIAECVEPPGYPHGPLEQEAIRKAAELVGRA